jgi:hypothetical protein
MKLFISIVLLSVILSSCSGRNTSPVFDSKTPFVVVKIYITTQTHSAYVSRSGDKFYAPTGLFNVQDTVSFRGFR